MPFLKENKRLTEITNIDKWVGRMKDEKPIKFAILDKKFNTQSPGAEKLYKGMVKGVNGFDTTEISSHGSAVAHIIHQAHDDCLIYCLRGRTEDVHWCIENNVDIINISLSMVNKQGFEEALNEFVAKGGWVFASAGNYGEVASISIPAKYHNVIGVGAAHLRYPGKKNEEIYLADYSSYTSEMKKSIKEMVEITGFSGIYVMTPKYPDIQKDGSYHCFQFNGTSGSSPFVASMAGYVRRVYGKVMLDDFREYMYRNVIDMKDAGFDRFTGHGLFKLPEFPSVLIRMYINKSYYEVNEIGKSMDTAPFIQDSRTFVPVRFVAEALGATVEPVYKIQGFQKLTDKVIIMREDTTIEMQIGNKAYKVNGKEKVMDVAPFIKDCRTMVPIRFIVEGLGENVFPVYDDNGVSEVVIG